MIGPYLDALEARQLLSVAIAPMSMGTTTSMRTEPAVSATAYDTPILQGTTINAIDDQSFRAFIGTIRQLDPLPGIYTLHGTINWGDGTPPSDAKFLPQPDGTIDVIGDHTYANVGAYSIKVFVTAEPPPWSELPVRLIGTIYSKANVIAASGGVTLEETAGVGFTERVGFFRTTVDAGTMSATIEWGDGTQSPGKIIPLPTAGPVPSYAVEGSHTYGTTASYLVHVTVYSTTPPPMTTAAPTRWPTATPPNFLVAQFDSVIDVLPAS